MKIMQSLRNLFHREKQNHSEANSINQNPNGWGRYEYGGQLFESINNHHFDANSNRLGWIQNYTNNRLLRAQGRKQKSTLVCVNCKTSYRVIS